jgi:ATP-binding cassette subfamily B (MDR/TAP) protein 1
MAKEAQVDAVVSVPEEETTTKKGKKGKKEKKEPEPQVKISELFQFATGFDVFVLSLAAVLAFFCGCLQIGTMMAFEVMMDGIGETAQAGEINTADYDWGWYLFIALGGGLWLSTFLYAGTADYCKERMTARWKMAYLKAIVRQDVGWYDTNNPEELSTRIGESIKNIEEGMASKLFLGVEMVGMGIAGIVLTGWYRWDMAIVVIATSPIIMAAGALLTNVQTTSTKKIQDAYAEAGGIAGEQLSAVRTVAALGIEDIGAARYSAKLSTAEAVTIKSKGLLGLANSLLFSAPNLCIAAGMIYGGGLFTLGLYDTAVKVQSNYSLVNEFVVNMTNANIDGFAPFLPENGGVTVQSCVKSTSCDEFLIFNLNQTHIDDGYRMFEDEGQALADVGTDCGTADTKCNDDILAASGAAYGQVIADGGTEAEAEAAAEAASADVINPLLQPHYDKLVDALTQLNTTCDELGLRQLKVTCATMELMSKNETTLELFGFVDDEGKGSRDEFLKYSHRMGGWFPCYTPTFPFNDHETPEDTPFVFTGYYLRAGAVLLSLFCFTQGLQGLGNVGQATAALVKARVAAVKVQETIQRKPTIDSFDEGGEKLETVRGDIEVKDVSFAYPSAPDHIVSKDLNLSITAGQMVALVGPSGCGKSTLIQLLERFYDPTAGSVLLDGADLKTLNLKWLRSQLGLVAQEPILFLGSISDNIGYGKEGATKEEIEAAAKMANAHGFITEKEEGYNIQVGQGGGKLSGGQKQRIAIARAMIKDPKVLLLDEATSALDTASERIVQAALDDIRTRQKRTTVAIAHRLSTIKHADCIFVIDNGSVAEKGKYDDLKAAGGLFSRLAKKQEETFKEGRESASAVEEQQPPEPTKGDSKSKSKSKGGLFGGPKSKSKSKKGEGEAEEEGEDAAPKKKQKGPAARLWGLKKEGDGGLTGAGLFFGAIASISFPALGLAFAKILTIFYYPNPGAIWTSAWVWALLMLVISVVSVVCDATSSYCIGAVGAHLTKNLRQLSMTTWLKQDMSFFDDDGNSSGDLTEFLGENITLVQSLLSEKLATTVRNFFTLVTGLVLMFLLSPWELVLFVLGCLPVMAVMMGLQVMIFTGQDEAKQGKQTDQMKADRSAGALVGEVVLAIRTVASFNAEHAFYLDYCARVEKQAAKQKKEAWGKGFFNGMAKGFPMWLLAGIGKFTFFIMEKRLAEEEFSLPEECDIFSIAFTWNRITDGSWVPMMVMFMMAVPLGMAASMATDAKAAKDAAEKLFNRLDRPSLIDPSDPSGDKLAAVKGEIEVRDVTFAYPTRPDAPVCTKLSLKISAGQMVALGGPSGCGKSTLIQLLERFYDPTAGAVLLDGADLKTLNLKWLRQQIGLVGQEPILFLGSVSDNIGYGKEGATKEEIEAAAKMANAHGFITDNLADGYNTDVGIRGGKLSGGQKQRVAIARALVRKPKILLLDEATSALDNESERIVQAALDEIMSQSTFTTVAIAHRLSTIMKADNIFVINSGEVVEKGKHDDLIKIDQGLYQKLWSAQQ